MKKFVTTLLLLATTFPTWAQGGFRIAGQIRGLADTPVVLAHYYGAGSYIPKDTARTDAAGKFTFSGGTNLPEGLYLVIPPSNKYIELVIGEQQFSFETDTTDAIGNMRVTGSRENELFYGYQQQLGKFYAEAQALRSGGNNGPMAALQQRAKAYRTQFLTSNATTFTAKLLRAADEPEVPTPPKTATGRPDSNWVFSYYKAHYWDGFDWADGRFLRTPMLQRKLDRYVKELTVQTTDSLTKEADWLVSRARANKDLLQYVIWYITNQYERPKTLGTDGVFIHMAEKYWLTGQIPVSDSSTLRNMRERVAILKPLQVGKPLPALSVSDTLGRPINLAARKADYTVMFFYDPACGHCRESAPKLKQFADAHKAKGVDVVAVAITDDPAGWKGFIREFGVGNWINGYDYRRTTDYRTRYDVVTTPTVYVLDRNRTIIARQLPVEQIEDFIEFHRHQPPKATPPKTAKASAKQ